ncbi:unnamed protein product [Cuscuta epithymum]|uniref:Uncharacterized protein n=1 Tax=Cuscuta epithymum TaxID=186058 RepID=A0AAV0CH43_9ASTE|nr:unnamed protein product [Cuscuta epithymum]CAH9121840.1 unnamed protein product [Cuscuta epithymum]
MMKTGLRGRGIKLSNKISIEKPKTSDEQQQHPALFPKEFGVKTPNRLSQNKPLGLLSSFHRAFNIFRIFSTEHCIKQCFFGIEEAQICVSERKMKAYSAMAATTGCTSGLPRQDTG